MKVLYNWCGAGNAASVNGTFLRVFLYFSVCVLEITMGNQIIKLRLLEWQQQL